MSDLDAIKAQLDHVDRQLAVLLDLATMAAEGVHRARLAPDGLDGVAIEAGVNARQALVAILADHVGLSHGAGTPSRVIAGGNVADPRIRETLDRDGNRVDVELTLPD